MKFKESIAEAEIVGDIKDSAVGVDAKDLAKIKRMLTSNMYSKPIESFIREITSNAWDAHVEAGSDEPIILQLGKEEDKYFCRIQDFGVGLSKDRVENIYKNIGKTTKDQSNDLLGGFGIGRFSAVAYAPKALITSVYNGVKSKYQMYKDGLDINISDLYDGPTDERNGVEVLVYFKDNYDLDSFKEAIKEQLPYFENVHVDIHEDLDKGFMESFNNLKIKDYNNFRVNSLLPNRNTSILLGKVLYPLRFDSIKTKNRNYPIALKFDIGELEIVPNREEIIYSSATVKIIEDKLQAAYDEIDKLIADNTKKNYTDLDKYINDIKNSSYNLLDENDTPVSIKLKSNQIKFTFKGEPYDANILSYIIGDISYYKLIKAYAYISHDRINQRINDNEFSFKYRPKILVADLSSINNISKRYLKEKYPEHYVIKHSKVSHFFKSYSKKYKQSNRYNLTNIKPKEFRIVFLDLLSKVSLEFWKESDIPDKWIKNEKQRQKDARALIKRKQTNWDENVKIYKVREGSGYQKIVADGETFSLDSLRKRSNLHIVFSRNEDEKAKAFYRVFKNHPNLNVVELAPSKMKSVENIRNFVKYQKMGDIVNYKAFRRLATAVYINDKLPELKAIASIRNLSAISPKLLELSKKITEYLRKYEPGDMYGDNTKDDSLISDIVSICKKHNYYDEEMKSLFDINFEMLNKAKFLISFVHKDTYSYANRDSIPDKHINLLVDYILCRKIFRPSLEAVKKLKGETIYNIKKEENEDTEIEF